MSARSAALPQPIRKRTRLASATLCTVLLAASVALMARELQLRREAWRVADRFGLAASQPALLSTLGIVRDDSDASAIVAEALLESPHANGGPAEARKLVLGGIADRPGCAHFRVLVARTAPASGQSALWERPLELAAAAAPSLDSPREDLAVRYLTAWPTLEPQSRAKAARVVGQAFRSASFVADSFAEASFALGPAEAVRLLPADRAVLMAALEVATVRGVARASELIRARLEGLSAGGAP
jgi:hypothetical protein